MAASIASLFCPLLWALLSPGLYLVLALAEEHHLHLFKPIVQGCTVGHLHLYLAHRLPHLHLHLGVHRVEHLVEVGPLLRLWC
jgi:hypothetical protein